MKYLLDTHAYLWWVVSPERLSKTVRDVIEDDASSIHLSAASAWEIAIKIALGKLSITVSANRLLLEEPATLRFVPLPVTAAHAVRAAGLPAHHDDPFDRMLVAQAQAEGMALLSRDRAVAAYPVEVVW